MFRSSDLSFILHVVLIFSISQRYLWVKIMKIILISLHKKNSDTNIQYKTKLETYLKKILNTFSILLKIKIIFLVLLYLDPIFVDFFNLLQYSWFTIFNFWCCFCNIWSNKCILCYCTTCFFKWKNFCSILFNF